MKQLVVFALDKQRFALALASVERVARLVAFTSLPKAPAIVLGVINVGGEIIPVYNLRQRFRLPQREMSLSDHLIIAKTSKRRVALVADVVDGVLNLPEEKIVPAEDVLPEMEYVQGIVKLREGLVLIHNLDEFLCPEEEATLSEALNRRPEAHDPVVRHG
jgi:purine-binding chemotaxis protein CheW